MLVCNKNLLDGILHTINCDAKHLKIIQENASVYLLFLRLKFH